jgi:hypothetical protein
MSGYTSVDAVQPVLLQGTALVNCQAGVVGAAAAGQAFDSVLHGVYILLNAVTAASVSIGGFQDNTGAAQPLVITGQIGADYFWTPPNPLLNRAGPMTFTPSVAAKVWVLTRAYIGPERPEQRINT